jgi:hypothetical protein
MTSRPETRIDHPGETIDSEMIHLADTQPDLPIDVAFVDAKGEPGWVGRDPALRIHRLSLRGSWPERLAENGQ